MSDVYSLHYDNRLTVAYRLCCVVESLPSYDGLVREVKFSFRPRRHTGAGTFLPVELNTPLLSLLRLSARMPTEMLGVRDFQRTYSSEKDSDEA